MAKSNFNPDHKTVLDGLLLRFAGVTAGVIFGLPCYKIHGVVFAVLYGDGIGIKLPGERVEELRSRPGFLPFRPYGKNRGKEFVQIRREAPEDYIRDQALFIESVEYVSALALSKK